MLPCVLFAPLIYFLLRPWRSARLRRMGLQSGRTREFLLLLFLIYCFGMAAVTLFPADFWSVVLDRLISGHPVGWNDLQTLYPSWEETRSVLGDLGELFVPFQEIRRAVRTRIPWLLFVLVGNVVMFMPLGLFAGLLWRGIRWWHAVFIGAFSSLSIETIQLFIGRVTDIDDLMLNTAGTVLGFWICCWIRCGIPKSAQLQCAVNEGCNP